MQDFNKVIVLNPNDDLAYYNLACYYSLHGDELKSCDSLGKAVEKGFKDWEHIKKDSDLNKIRNADCYKKIMEGR